MSQITDLKMAVDATFSSIINEIQLSNLNFSLQITPFSAYITLKKSVIKDQNGNQAVPSPPILFVLQQAQQTIQELREENEQLKIKCDATEKKNDILVNDKATVVEALAVSDNNLAASLATNNSMHSELEAAEKRIIEIEASLKDAKKRHLQEINHANAVIKTLEKGSKGLEKEIHDLNRSLGSTRVTLKNLKTEHSSLKMNKTKLEKEIMKLEKIVSKRDSKISLLSKKDVNKNDVKFTDTGTSLFTSSPCSSSSIKSLSSTLSISAPSTPFTSMITHWNPLPTIPPLMPDSITTMVTHCIRLPPPICSFMSTQEFQEMMERILERAFSNLRWNPLDAKIEL